MRSLLGAALVIWMLSAEGGCSKSDLVIKVGNIPAEARTLQAIARVEGVQSGDMPRFELPPTDGSPLLSFTLGLRLHERVSGEAIVAIAARDAGDCLLTTGSGRLADLGSLSSGSDELLVLLPSPPPRGDSAGRCPAEVPSLLSASEQIENDGASKRLLLQGWGFQPGASVTVSGATAAELRAQSPAELTLPLPQVTDPSGVQTFEIVVTNPDGGRTSISAQITRALFSTVDTLLYQPDSSSGPSIFSGLVVDDLNGDGRPDIALSGTQVIEVPGSSINVGFVRVFLQQADGRYPATPANYALGSGAVPLGLAAGDFDGNGHLDLAVPTSIEVLKTIGFVTVMYGQPDGTLSQPSNGFTNLSYPIDTDSLAVATMDEDSDGKSELLLFSQNYFLPVPQLAVLGFQDLKTFKDKWGALLLFGLGQIRQVSVADLNQDGLPDVAISSMNTTTHRAQAALLIRTPASATSQFTMEAQLDIPGIYGGIAAGNIQNRPYPELVIANLLDAAASPRVALDSVSVVTIDKDLASGNSTLGPAQAYAVGSAPVSVAIGDYDANGKSDLVVATVSDYLSTDSSLRPAVKLKILLNQSALGLPVALKTLPTLDAGLGRSAAIVSRDINRDGRPDLIVANTGDLASRLPGQLYLFTAQP